MSLAKYNNQKMEKKQRSTKMVVVECGIQYS